MNKAALKYKKEIKDELSLDGFEGMNLKISKFKIEKNKINSPAFDLKIAANMFNINWDLEIYGYLKIISQLLLVLNVLENAKVFQILKI